MAFYLPDTMEMKPGKTLLTSVQRIFINVPEESRFGRYFSYWLVRLEKTAKSTTTWAIFERERFEAQSVIMT
jgi:hypothetical protein